MKRLAASFEIAGRDRGFDPADIEVGELFKELKAGASSKQRAKAMSAKARTRDSMPGPTPTPATGSPVRRTGKSDAFDRAIAGHATAYADQNERDYQTMVDAVSSGRLHAQPGM